MSDERDDPERSERDDRARPPERGGRDPDEPLGDLAEEVRRRRGERSRRDETAASGRDGERRTRDERPDRSEREGPLADVAAAVDERRTRKRGEDDAFESVDVDEIDGERLWAELAAGEEGTTAAVPAEQSGDGTVSSGNATDSATNATTADATTADSAATDSTANWVAGAADRTADHAGRDVRTIPKATCHGCPHFGDPPELACTNGGTDILAMVDSDHFRVADCPMVVDGEEDIGSITDTDGEPDES